MRMGINYRQDNWVALIDRIQFTINTAISPHLGFSPYFIERGRHPSLPLDRDVTTRQQRQTPEKTEDFVLRMWMLDDQLRERRRHVDLWHSQNADQRRRHVDERIKVGGLVWLSTNDITLPWDKERRTKKLRQKYYGPFEVLQQTSPVSFRLRLPDTSNLFPIFHANLLLPASDVDMHGSTRRTLPALSSEDNTYEVESILARRVTGGGKEEYLVHWKSYLYEEATWEPRDNLDGCKDLIDKFDATYGDELPHQHEAPKAKRNRLQDGADDNKRRRKAPPSTAASKY